MKRIRFIRYLKENNCTLIREGSKHSLFMNLQNMKKSTVPRHPNIKESLCRKICKDLEIADILKK
jgi:mRNA interferase HicA